MMDTVEVVLVTLVAVAALLMLVRQYFPRRSPNTPAPGCSNCASAPAHGQKPAPTALPRAGR
jgi:hypothetical protein